MQGYMAPCYHAYMEDGGCLFGFGKARRCHCCHLPRHVKPHGGPNRNHVTSWWLQLTRSGPCYAAPWVDTPHMQHYDKRVLISGWY